MRANTIASYLAIAAVALSTSLTTQAQPSREPAPALRAGAARVDYTPRGPELPGNFTGVLDPIFVRTLVLDNGSTRAALVAVDAGAIPSDLYQKVSARAAAELDIAAKQLLISASHTHSVPFRLDAGVEETILRSLRESIARLQPAQVAWGTGVSHINVNRDRIDPQTQGWWEGPELRRPIRQNRGGSARRDAGWRAHRRLFQLCRARCDHRHPRHDQRRHPGSGVALRRGVPRRRRGRTVDERRGRRPEPDLLQSDVRAAARSASQTTRPVAKTSATPCRRGARDSIATIRVCSCSWRSRSE